MKTGTICIGFVLALLYCVCAFTPVTAAAVPKITAPAEQAYLKEMKAKETAIKKKLRLKTGPTCAELSRSIKEYEEGIWMLGASIAELKKQVRELQNQVPTPLVEEKLRLRLYLYEEWNRLMRQFKQELAALKQTATDKNCHPNLINPCSVQQNGQLRCR